MENSKVDPSTGQFIDPMFAVVIAAAVTETFVAWTKSGTKVPDFFGTAVVTMGYINLLLSWFGYHKSVHKSPIKGGLRFIVTVVLLPSYLMTIIMWEKEFFYVASTYALIFFLWSLWEKLKYVEYKRPQGFWSLQFRLFNVIVYAAALYAFIASYYLKALYANSWFVKNADLISLIFIFSAIIILRVSKSKSSKDGGVSIINSEVSALLFGSNNKEDEKAK